MNPAAGYCLFDTALGRCAIAWRGERVRAFALAAADDAATIKQLERRLPGCAPALPPEPVAAAIGAVQRLLEGEPADLADVAVDLDGVPDFERRIYALLRAVPPGATITYGELAAQAGSPGAARAVGAAMGRNPIPVIIPCHRVLAGGGRAGGFSAPGGVSTKFRLLEIERARRGGEALLFADLPLATSRPPPWT
jgi:methylated-DNA-[protein]-cysteine S-methyltransferase